MSKICCLIDDDKIFNLISTKIIEKSGWDVKLIVFTNAADALELFSGTANQLQDIPETILLDVRMPEMDGFTFLDELMKLNPRIQNYSSVFMLTSSLDDRDMERALSYPIVKRFLNKPLSMQDLQSIILG